MVRLRFQFQTMAFLADNGFERGLKFVEENPSTAVVFQDNPRGHASRERSKKFFQYWLAFFEIGH